MNCPAVQSMHTKEFYTAPERSELPSQEHDGGRTPTSEDTLGKVKLKTGKEGPVAAKVERQSNENNSI